MNFAPALPASSLILIRQGSELEVFLTQRHPQLKFLGGFYAFLGGRRDEEDFSPQAIERMKAKNLKEKAEAVESDEEYEKKLGYYATAIREAFEEAGILFVCDREQNPVSIFSGAKEKLAQFRLLLQNEKLRFIELLNELDLYYDLDQLFWFARWITPKTSPKRFDTQFFCAPLPEGQNPEIYDQEISQGIWITPEKALERWKNQEIKMIPPTIASLDRLSQYQKIEELLQSLS